MRWMRWGSFDDWRPRAYPGGPRRPWTGEELRNLRAAKGVGRRHPQAHYFEPHVLAWIRRCAQVNEMYARWKHGNQARDEHLAWQHEIAAAARDAAL